VELLTPEEIDFEKYLKETEQYQKVRPVSVFVDEIEDQLKNPKPDTKCFMPWKNAEMTFHFRAGEVTVYAGSNGGGKSLITGQVALSLIKQKQRVCIASFEMKPIKTIQRMLRQFAGEDLENPLIKDKANHFKSALQRFKKFTDEKLWLYDQQGTMTPEQIIAVTRYCAIELKIQHMFIDSLMKCMKAEDDYNAQKAFVDELTAIARDHNMHIHLVHHIRKLGNQELMPSKTDLKGSGAIADQVDNVLLMHRNKKKEHDLSQGKEVLDTVPDAYLMCEKQRNGEHEEWYQLWYNRESQQFLDSPDGFKMVFEDNGKF
jgi:twinkle protein